MDLSILTLILSICTLAIVVYIFLKLRDQKTIESGKSENLENKIDSVSKDLNEICLLYTSPSPRDRQKSRMPSSA